MTLFMLGNFPDLVASPREAAIATASSLAMPPFRIVLDRLTFGGKSVLLTGSEVPRGLDLFRAGCGTRCGGRASCRRAGGNMVRT